MEVEVFLMKYQQTKGKFGYNYNEIIYLQLKNNYSSKGTYLLLVLMFNFHKMVFVKSIN